MRGAVSKIIGSDLNGLRGWSPKCLLNTSQIVNTGGGQHKMVPQINHRPIGYDLQMPFFPYAECYAGV